MAQGPAAAAGFKGAHIRRISVYMLVYTLRFSLLFFLTPRLFPSGGARRLSLMRNFNAGIKWLLAPFEARGMMYTVADVYSEGITRGFHKIGFSAVAGIQFLEIPDFFFLSSGVIYTRGATKKCLFSSVLGEEFMLFSYMIMSLPVDLSKTNCALNLKFLHILLRRLLSLLHKVGGTRRVSTSRRVHILTYFGGNFLDYNSPASGDPGYCAKDLPDGT